MIKSVLVLLFGILLVSSALEAVSKSEGEGESIDDKKLSEVMSSSVRSLSLNSLVGKWYEGASSQEVQTIFQKDCQCLTFTFTRISNDKLQIMNECLNKTTNKMVAVDGSLTRVIPEFPGAFRMEFKSEDKNGAGVLENQKEDRTKKANVNVKKEKSEKISGAGKQQQDLAKMIEEKDINFLVLKNVENKAMLIGGPSSELIWVLSRTPKLDDSILRSFNNEAKRLDFQPLVKSASCPSSAQH